MPDRVAVVDVGTNSVRLLVAELGRPLSQVRREMRITRLGKGVDAKGHLDDGALAATLDVLGEYAELWSRAGVRRAGVWATSAVRDAADRDRFFDGVRERTGVDATVLTGTEEAHAAYRGAVSSVTTPAPRLVLDIGGGSTELILGEDEPVAVTSQQLGCVRLTERALPSDPPTETELAEARRLIDERLDAVDGVLDVRRAAALIGVAGTVTTIGALHLGLAAYEPERIHATRVPIAAVRNLSAELGARTAAQRADLGPMQPGREDVIVGGALVLERVMERYGFDEVVVSEADILDGLALELLAGAG